MRVCTSATLDERIGDFSLVVTTDPNELMSQVHPRMPVIIHQRDYDRWLSRDVSEQPPMT